ncbi:MAG TPA: beta-ketoacyl synthase N-terminal-like domain-containing protein, partial [Afifellaceae bacterium]|nr:beta-ketoacyl synthase N-terminal-like domain-containing protein [Afifellaceae bacterium]
MATSHRDHLGRPVVAVTGLGVVTSLGKGKDDNWDALTAGQSGIREIKRFETEGLRTRIAGTVDFIDDRPETAADLSYALAELAAGEAIGEAGLPHGRFPGPLFMAIPPVEMEWQQRLALDAAGAEDEDGYGRLFSGLKARNWSWPYNRFVFAGVAERTAETFGTQGAPISLSTACASGATAIQLGVEAIRRGDCEVALCIGTDGSINTETLIRFSLLSALSTKNDPPEQAIKPFSRNRDGFIMAEGSGALVIESLDHALARGAEVLAIIAGIGERADDFHRTR